MDDVLCEYKKAYYEKMEENPGIKYPQSQYGFFRDLKPLAGGIEAVKKLSSYEDTEIYIVTAPSLKNPLSYSEKREWVEKNLGMNMVERLIISPNKGLNKGDYLIDDNDRGKGQENFEGKLIKFGSNEFPDWISVLEYFEKNKKTEHKEG